MIEDIRRLIVETTHEMTENEEIEVSGEIDGDTALFGPNGVLDSMGLVSLVIAVEQAIEEEFETRISLADEKALSQKHSPYRLVSSLANYAAKEIEAKKGSNG